MRAFSDELDRQGEKRCFASKRKKTGSVFIGLRLRSG